MEMKPFKKKKTTALSTFSENGKGILKKKKN